VSLECIIDLDLILLQVQIYMLLSCYTCICFYLEKCAFILLYMLYLVMYAFILKNVLLSCYICFYLVMYAFILKNVLLSCYICFYLEKSAFSLLYNAFIVTYAFILLLHF